MEGKKKDAKIIQKILNAEQRRYTFQKIKSYVGKQKQALSCLVVPPHIHPIVDNDQEQFIVEKEEMEKTLVARNSKHLHQAHASTVVQSGCVEKIQDETAQQQILQGTFDTTVDEGFRRLTKGLKQRIPELGNIITKQKLQQV